MTTDLASVMQRLAARHPELRVPCPCGSIAWIPNPETWYAEGGCGPCYDWRPALGEGHAETCQCRGSNILPLPLNTPAEVDRAVGALMRVLKSRLSPADKIENSWTEKLGEIVTVTRLEGESGGWIAHSLVLALARAVEAQEPRP